MDPTKAMDIATVAAAKAQEPGGLTWLLMVIIIMLLIVVIFFGRYLFSQTGKLNDFLQTSHQKLVETVAQNTHALEQTNALQEKTNVIVEKCTDQLKLMDRRDS